MKAKNAIKERYFLEFGEMPEIINPVGNVDNWSIYKCRSKSGSCEIATKVYMGGLIEAVKWAN